MSILNFTILVLLIVSVLEGLITWWVVVKLHSSGLRANEVHWTQQINNLEATHVANLKAASDKYQQLEQEYLNTIEDLNNKLQSEGKLVTFSEDYLVNFDNRRFLKEVIKDQSRELISDFFKKLEEAGLIDVGILLEEQDDGRVKVTYNIKLDHTGSVSSESVKLSDYEQIYEALIQEETPTESASDE